VGQQEQLCWASSKEVAMARSLVKRLPPRLVSTCRELRLDQVEQAPPPYSAHWHLEFPAQVWAWRREGKELPP
jgi:hypothetical protein